MKIKPIGNRVLVEKMEAESKTATGIIIPDTAKEKPQSGKVVAIGDSEDKPLPVKVGDVVLYAKFAGTEIDADGKEYLILKEEDLVAIVQ